MKTSILGRYFSEDINSYLLTFGLSVEEANRLQEEIIYAVKTIKKESYYEGYHNGLESYND